MYLKQYKIIYPFVYILFWTEANKFQIFRSVYSFSNLNDNFPVTTLYVITVAYIIFWDLARVLVEFHIVLCSRFIQGRSTDCKRDSVPGRG